MAHYDYVCGGVQSHQWEETRAIADRHDPASCPSCGAAGVLVFTPSRDIVVSRAFLTRFSDIAPLDAGGHAMSFTETVKSGKFDKYRPDVREEAVKAQAAHDAKMEPILREQAKTEAWKKLKAAERMGLKPYTDDERRAGEALADLAESGVDA